MLTWLFAEVNPRPLGLARVIVGAAALIRSVVAWQVLFRLAEPGVMHAPYFDWIPSPSVPLAIVVIVVWVVSSVLFMVGWKVPVSGTLLFSSIVVTLALDQQAYGNHVYLMAWVVLLLTLAGAGSGMNIGRTDRLVVRWPVLLVMAQLSIVYGFSALTKLNASFLSGRVLAGTLGTGLVPFPEGLKTPAFLSIMATVAVIVELFIAVFIWRPGFRPAAFVFGLGLHAAITLSMFGTLQLLVFSLLMLSIYPLFLPSERLSVAWDDDCGSCRDWIRRFGRLDVLRLLDPVAKTDPRNPVPAELVEESMYLVSESDTYSGFRAVTGILEHVVPTLWIAPVLRLPGVRGLGERWYRWQARRRSCPVGTAPAVRRDSTAR